jgi:hypothetical protein
VKSLNGLIISKVTRGCLRQLRWIKKTEGGFRNYDGVDRYYSDMVSCRTSVRLETLKTCLPNRKANREAGGLDEE